MVVLDCPVDSDNTSRRRAVRTKDTRLGQCSGMTPERLHVAIVRHPAQQTATNGR